MAHKHTPGPWFPRKSFDGIRYIGVAEIGSNIADTAICEFCGSENDKANAQLIAAAPELLEALEEIVTCEENRAKDLRHRKAWELVKFSEQRIKKAKAAIAKAKGE